MSAEYLDALRRAKNGMRDAWEEFADGRAGNDLADDAIDNAFAHISNAHGYLSTAIKIMERAAKQANKETGE